jgi:hypothetical protein
VLYEYISDGTNTIWVDISSTAFAANTTSVATVLPTYTGNISAGNIAVTGNITGNVTGNITGNITGNLTGNVTGSVTAANVTTSTLTLGSVNVVIVSSLPGSPTPNTLYLVTG